MSKNSGCWLSSISLRDFRFNVTRAENTTRLTVCDSIADLDAVVSRKPDFVLLVAKYLPIQNTDKRWFSDYFL